MTIVRVTTRLESIYYNRLNAMFNLAQERLVVLRERASFLDGAFCVDFEAIESFYPLFFSRAFQLGKERQCANVVGERRI